MRKTTLMLMFALLMVITAKAQQANFGQTWLSQIGSGGPDFATSTLDADGNLYTTGYFSGTADFDPGAGVLNLVSSGTQDLFIQKIDSNGQLLWVRQIGGTLSTKGNAVAVDGAGSVYLTGTFDGTVDFNPNSGTVNLSSNGLEDIFVLKLTTNGFFVWVRQAGNSGSDLAKGIACDPSGNVLITGSFEDTVDFNPNSASLLLVSKGRGDIFIQKLTHNGSLLWAKSMGDSLDDVGNAITTDALGNVYTTGSFYTADFDPDTAVFILQSMWLDAFIQKLDPSGNFIWARRDGMGANDAGNDIVVDAFGNVHVVGILFTTLAQMSGQTIRVLKLDANNGNITGGTIFGQNLAYPWPTVHATGGIGVCTDALGNVYITGNFQRCFFMQVDVNCTTDPLGSDVFILKMDRDGRVTGFTSFGGAGMDAGNSICVHNDRKIYVTGTFENVVDFDPSAAINTLSAVGDKDAFVAMFVAKGARGKFYQDIDLNCTKDSLEGNLPGPLGLINPGNILVQADYFGWKADSLPLGNYTITVDTSGPWRATCSPTASFSVTNLETTIAPSIGLVAKAPCTQASVMMGSSDLRPGGTNIAVHVRVSNGSEASKMLGGAYVIVELDTHLTVQTVSRPYLALGNNRYRVEVDSLYSGQSFNIIFYCDVSIYARIGQTLCSKVNLYPIEPCLLDAIPYYYPVGVNPCNTAWDQSSLTVEVSCDGDSIRFVVHNQGDAMSCYAPIRLYVDGIYASLDSILLGAGDSAVFVIPADGRTWRLETDQHPLHPGNSHPNASIELCGDTLNWTPYKINVRPMDDADPIVDIQCDEIRGAHDPNDKTGFPLGVTDTHYVAPNQQMEYLIRFQNTGNDTAFTVVIRDTLDVDFDIFSVRSGASSHAYSFRMYGPRVLEWTFNNIMLPDSNVNEPASHGFVNFSVNQQPNLPDFTELNNSVGIYFDFNAPVQTNTTSHVIKRSVVAPFYNTPNPVVELSQAAATPFRLYPNPNNGHFTLDLGENRAQQILLYDSMGRLLQSFSELGSQHFDLNLPSGLYLLQVQSERGQEILKFIVN